MTFLDIILIISLLGFLLLGFSQGVIKVLFIIFGTYLGLLAGATIYQPIAKWLAPMVLGKTCKVTEGYELVIFFIIVFIVAIFLTVFLFSSFRYAALPNSLLSVDRVGGMVLGIVLGVLVLSIVVLFLRTASDIASAGAGGIPIIGFAIEDVGKSQVAKVLLSTRDVIRVMVSPLINAGDNPLFAPSING
jgi:uncharacterized membrane protein required for colicin V production